mmetsp:Transcript_25442/g.52101  ORF Transcript_25442/g.52101 Transcript_25442/m.52101 type:complete len:213 (-) Transcript_25442:339-977(-)
MNIQLVSPPRNTRQSHSRHLLPFDFLPPLDDIPRQTLLRTLQYLLPHIPGTQTDQSPLMFFRRHSHIRWEFVISHQRQFDLSFVLFQMPAYEGFVLTGDFSGAEEGVHGTESGFGAGEDDEAGGVHAQAVDYHFVHAVGFAAEAGVDGLDEGGVGGVGRDGEHSGGFVDDNDVFVFVDYVEIIRSNGMRTPISLLQFCHLLFQFCLYIGRIG